MKVLLDTNAFNAVLERSLSRSDFIDEVVLHATYHQREELENTADAERRTNLLATYNNLAPILIATPSCLPGISVPDTCCPSDGVFGTQLTEAFLGDRPAHPRDRRDILLAETAIAGGLIFVTHDKYLYALMVRFAGAACNLFAILRSATKPSPILL